jgi:hypothetical protein
MLDLPANKAVTFAKIVIRIGLLAWVSYLCLWLYYGFSRPTVAQPEAGRWFALDTHGHIAYLTSREMANLHLLLETSGGLTAIAIATAIFAKFRTPNP